MKPLFSDLRKTQKISLLQGNEVISSDQQVADIFDEYLVNSVRSLDLVGNNVLLTSTGNQDNPVEIALIKFENHPSVIEIKRNINIKQNLSFSEVRKEDV